MWAQSTRDGGSRSIRDKLMSPPRCLDGRNLESGDTQTRDADGLRLATPSLTFRVSVFEGRGQSAHQSAVSSLTSSSPRYVCSDPKSVGASTVGRAVRPDRAP
eukprot:4927992-Prymnesium_polylepis.1